MATPRASAKARALRYCLKKGLTHRSGRRPLLAVSSARAPRRVRPRAHAIPCRLRCKARERASGGVQLVERSLLGDAPVFQHDDLVHVVQPMQAMRGEEHEASLHERQHPLLELHLRFDVEVGGGLVEQQNAARVVQEGPRERDPLRLPARERPRPFAHYRVQAFRQLGHQVVQADHLHGAIHLGARRLGTVERDVLAQGRVER